MQPKSILLDLPSTHDVVNHLHNEFVRWVCRLEVEIKVVNIFHGIECYWCTGDNKGGQGIHLNNCGYLDSWYDKGSVPWCYSPLDWDRSREMEGASWGHWFSVDIGGSQWEEPRVIHRGSVWPGWDNGQESLQGKRTNTFDDTTFLRPGNSCSLLHSIMRRITQLCVKRLKTSTYDESFPLGGQTRTSYRAFFSSVVLWSYWLGLITLQMSRSRSQPCKCCCDGPHHKDCSGRNDDHHLGIWPITAWQPHP